MKYNELQTNSAKNKKRVGRGISAGQGKTAGRGTKGQNSRTGKKLGATFMGGQGPLVQRIPKKKGFRSLRAPAQVVYLEQLNQLEGKVADNTTLYEAGLIATPFHTVKVITKGELTKALTVRVQAASASAKVAITAAGGSFEGEPVALKIAETEKE
jgi:large subunit ribosomal protein L15